MLRNIQKHFLQFLVNSFLLLKENWLSEPTCMSAEFMSMTVNDFFQRERIRWVLLEQKFWLYEDFPFLRQCCPKNLMSPWFSTEFPCWGFIPVMMRAMIMMANWPCSMFGNLFWKWCEQWIHSWVYDNQGCIFRLTCSHPELTKDRVLTSAYVKIFRTVTRNAVNKSVWRKKDCSWLPLNKHAMIIFI